MVARPASLGAMLVLWIGHLGTLVSFQRASGRLQALHDASGSATRSCVGVRMNCVLEDCRRLACTVDSCRCKPCECGACSIRRKPPLGGDVRPLEGLNDEGLRAAVLGAVKAGDAGRWREARGIWRDRLDAKKPGSSSRAMGQENEPIDTTPGVDSLTNFASCQKCGRSPLQPCEECDA